MEQSGIQFPVLSIQLKLLLSSVMLCAAVIQTCGQPLSGTTTEGNLNATINASESDGLRTYTLRSNAELRDNRPADHQATFAETPDHARVRSGNLLFDG